MRANRRHRRIYCVDLIIRMTSPLPSLGGKIAYKPPSAFTGDDGAHEQG